MIVQMILNPTADGYRRRDSMTVMSELIRFPLRFSSPTGSVPGLLISPGHSSVDLDGDIIHVRMGWAFSARIPRRLDRPGRAREAAPDPAHRRRHGWNGRCWSTVPRRDR